MPQEEVAAGSTPADDMQNVRFFSEDLPASLADQAKFDAWLVFYGSFHTTLEIKRAGHRSFFVRFAAAQAAGVHLSRIEGGSSRVARTATAMETAENNDPPIAMNIASSPLFHSQGCRRGRGRPGRTSADDSYRGGAP